MGHDDKKERSQLVQRLADELRNGWVSLVIGEEAATELERLEDLANMLGQAALSAIAPTGSTPRTDSIQPQRFQTMREHACQLERELKEPRHMKIRLNEEQSNALREWIDGSDVTLYVGEGHSGHGLYCSINDYPEEGAEFIAPTDGKVQT